MKNRFRKIFCLVILFNILFLNCHFAHFTNFIVLAQETNPAQNSQSENKYPIFSQFYINQDVHEKFNRKIFNINLKVNKIFVKNVHILWASLVPKFIIDSLNLAYSNIEYPKKVVSALLQKDFDAIKHETKRFLINTTLGFAGLVDMADRIFNLEPYNEDMEQALAKCKMKCGNYLVLPFLSSTSSRDIMGRILDFALNPTTYIASPVAAAIKMGLLINRTTFIQPIIKMVESNFVDPYDVAREFYGIDKYIKLSNYDRKNVIENIKETYNDDEKELVDNNENLQVKGKVQDGENLIVTMESNNDLTADIALLDYNAQNPVMDSMRTALFDLKSSNKSIWQEISLWNRNFDKKIKTASVEITPNREKYFFRYILQKQKASPLAIILPSIGEGINNSHSSILADMFYKEGYSVIILGSHFQWEFLKSMEKGYKPGLIQDDVKYINLAIEKIIKYLSEKYDRVFLERTALGTSLGAFSTLFLANNQYQTGANNIDKFIAICPPYELLYAIDKIDNIMESWQKYPGDLGDKIALCAAKVMRIYKDKEKVAKDFSKLPFSNFEAKLISAFIFHQKLSDLVLIIEKENNPNQNQDELYSLVHKIDYKDYMEKYFLSNHSKDELNALNSLGAIQNYLINNDNYKIYHSLDDYLINKAQLKLLKNLCDDKLVLFSNGAHLGFLYRDEFINELISDIKLNSKGHQEKFDPDSNKNVKKDSKDNENKEALSLLH